MVEIDCEFIKYKTSKFLSSILIELLQQTPHVSSLSIYLDHFESFFKAEELCKYLNQMVRKFCHSFSNLEQEHLLLLLTHLLKLSCLYIMSFRLEENIYQF